MSFFHICLDAVGYVLLEVVVEEAVVVEVIALRTEECCTVSRDAVELGIDGGDDDGTADGVNAGVGNTWDDELALDSQRAEVLLDRGGGIVALPVDGVDADATRGEGAVADIALDIGSALGVPRHDDASIRCALSELQTGAGEELQEILPLLCPY